MPPRGADPEDDVRLARRARIDDYVALADHGYIGHGRVGDGHSSHWNRGRDRVRTPDRQRYTHDVLIRRLGRSGGGEGKKRRRREKHVQREVPETAFKTVQEVSSTGGRDQASQRRRSPVHCGGRDFAESGFSNR